MSDYKDTLNLPHTDFPMRANLSVNEPKILKKWQADNLYQLLSEKNQGKPQFILHDGPPYANGDIHIGHAVNKILKDIIVKLKRLEGFDAPFLPGWDCHGLPIELNVEKKKGKVNQKISAKDFRLACSEYADKQVDKQKADFKRLGVLAGWQHPYLTKDYRYEADIIRALGVIIKNGHLSQGVKPVYWCCDCSSALAEAEVEYQEKQSPAIYVKFTFAQDIFQLDKPVAILIWTTTPWTLPANEAVAVHPDFNYTLVRYQNDYLLIAKDCLKNIDFEVIATNQSISGRQLEHRQLKHPFYDKQVPIIFGAHVNSDSGTGAVHTAPAHGQDDFTIGLNYQLPVNNLIDRGGVFFKTVPLVGGQFIFKANQTIIAQLNKNHQLVKHNLLTHSYPHCWRHKTPVIFRTTPQWFIAMDKKGLRKAALAQIKQVHWLPNWGQRRIELMVENRPDWCISRQRFWGVPIVLFVHKKTKQLHPKTMHFIEAAAQKVEQNGIDSWFSTTADELLGDEAEQYEKINDTLDVWFDSGVSHFAVLNQQHRLKKPADLYLEGSDQHRGWFQSSLLTSVAMDKTAPYKEVLTHGFTVDGTGRKMSKSLGNVISPQKVTNRLGADILRLWVASSDYSNEMAVSDEILKGISESYRRIRNTLRFMLANMAEFLPSKHLLAGEDMLLLDRWIVAKAYLLTEQIKSDYQHYQFHLIYQKIVGFCSNELSSFYLDIIKDRQYTCEKNSIARRSAQSALYHLTQTIVRLIAPILSFTAEEVWQHLPEKSTHSIFLEDNFYLNNNWAHYDDIRFDKLRSTMMPPIKKAIEKMRIEKKIGSSLEAEVDLYCKQKQYDLLKQFGDELRFIFIVSALRLHLSQTGKFYFKIHKSKHRKCVRCWHYRADVGSYHKHPLLCGRCIDNISGSGEYRAFA